MPNKFTRYLESNYRYVFKYCDTKYNNESKMFDYLRVFSFVGIIFFVLLPKRIHRIIFLQRKSFFHRITNYHPQIKNITK